MSRDWAYTQEAIRSYGLTVGQLADVCRTICQVIGIDAYNAWAPAECARGHFAEAAERKLLELMGHAEAR